MHCNTVLAYSTTPWVTNLLIFLSTKLNNLSSKLPLTTLKYLKQRQKQRYLKADSDFPMALLQPLVMKHPQLPTLATLINKGQSLTNPQDLIRGK